jgi:hypothetical protein
MEWVELTPELEQQIEFALENPELAETQLKEKLASVPIEHLCLTIGTLSYSLIHALKALHDNHPQTYREIRQLMLSEEDLSLRQAIACLEFLVAGFSAGSLGLTNE